MDKYKLDLILKSHALYFDSSTEGKVADLRDVDIQGANFRNSNLTDADLDFSSGIPFSCKSTQITGCSRLFSHMVYHLTRQNWSACTKEDRLWFASIPNSIKNGFCNFRDDIDRT